jgi:hypothetical protein
MFNRRLPVRPRWLGPLALAAAAGMALATAAPAQAALAQAATAQAFPSYTLDQALNLNGDLTADIAGSAFTGADGAFRWISSYAAYSSTDIGYDETITYNAPNLGAMNELANAGDFSYQEDDTFYGKPGSLCYEVDKATVNPAPSPYEDDHCDVVGVWVDPSNGYWYGVVNDEYDFDPWATGNPTVGDRVLSGIHGNRILTAWSDDDGANWHYGGEIITSPYTDHDAFDAAAFPGKTWDYGVAGVRLYVDYATGYFYLYYNTTIKLKPGYSSVYEWNNLARAPISGKMAPGTWDKYYDGGWTQPGVGGLDGQAGDPLGLSPGYDPATDMVNFTGSGADGQHVDYQSVYVGSDSTFTFDDASGNAYTANVKTGAITTSSGAAVPSVTYSDPELDSTVTVSGANSEITVSVTTAAGATRSSVISYGVLEDTRTHRLYLPATEIYESAITYNTYSGGYLSVGYDTYAYATDNLGEPGSLQIVGAEPQSATGSYLSSLDYGSLTNQNVSSSSYQMISDLTGQMWDVTIAKPTAGETDYLRYKAPSDSSGMPVNSASAYGLAVGGVPLSGQWRLVPVADSFDSSLTSGMYKIENVVTGQYLQALGSTVDAQRAFGASVGLGAAQPDYNPAGNDGNGSPGGSDQWYLEPVGRDIPATLSASSPRSVVAAADRTSIAGITTYKLVNRNSGLVLQYLNGQWELRPQEFGNTHQILTITRLG